MFYIFVFKQKTAYEMRISDWSSDVCSSDLLRTLDFGVPIRALDEPHRQAPPGRRTEGISPGDHRRGAALVRLHRHAEAIPAGDCGIGGDAGDDVERHFQTFAFLGVDRQTDRKSTRLNSSH